MRKFKEETREVKEQHLSKVLCDLCGREVEYWWTLGMDQHYNTPGYFSFKNMNQNKMVNCDICIKCSDTVVEFMESISELNHGPRTTFWDPMGG